MSPITVSTIINRPVAHVWELWTKPEHITQWNNASDDWHTPQAQNDLRVGGTFTSTMAAKDGSAQFDFTGTYDRVEPLQLISYHMPDDRAVSITFTANDNTTTVTETFDPEQENTLELQQQGWQAILDNFKKYAEA